MPSTRREHLLTLGAAVATAAWPALAAAAPAAGAPPAVGSTLPLPPRIRLLDGRVLTPADLHGKVVVLQYWATWCPFCAREMPALQKLWQSHRSDGLLVLGLSIDHDPAVIAPVLQARHIDYPVAWLDPQLARALPKPKGLPVVIVLGRDGRVLQTDVGEMLPDDIADFAKYL